MRRTLALVLAFGALAMSAGEIRRPTGRVGGEPGVVRVEQGLLRGARESGVEVFRGVPFAAPPVGPLRWQPPGVPEPWTGVRDALSFGPQCPQLDDRGRVVGEEDCLQLNLWTPAVRTPGELLPVMVFIHGGGHVQGSATVPAGPGKILYDGARLAGGRRVVVVTVQYRLGPLGFVSIPELDAERADGGSGNFGTLDLVAALGWVRHNIAGFGGDPSRVMIFGESAGAVETCMLLVARPAADLFSAALMQSGGCTAQDLTEARSTGAELVVAAGCSGSGDAAACMRSLSVEDVVLAIPAQAAVSGPQGPFGPVVDGAVIPGDPLEVIRTGGHHAVPFVVGANADETGRDAPALATDAEYRAAVLALAFGSQALADLVLARYPSADYPSPRAAYVAVTSDAKFVCTARRVARAAREGQLLPVWRYFFARPYRGGSTLLESFGAFHGAELPYVFGDLDISGYDPPPEEEALSSAMGAAWAMLAGSGRPGAVEGVPWPQYATGDDPFLMLDVPVSAQDGVRTEQCDFWDDLVSRGR